MFHLLRSIDAYSVEILVTLDTVPPEYVRMGERAHRLRFAHQERAQNPAARLTVGARLLQLERDDASEPMVSSAIDCADPTRTDAVEDLVDHGAGEQTRSTQFGPARRDRERTVDQPDV